MSKKRSIVEFKKFTFQYEAQSEPTLKNIDLTIYEGEKVLIVGASGSGKSTLIKCLNGLIPQFDAGEWSGEVAINDLKLGEASVYDLSLISGTVLQDTDGQFVGLTVEEDMAFSLENDNIAQFEMKNAVQNWAKRLGIRSLLREKPQNLSGGQKQRVSVAGVLIDETPVLLFDEPLASLDPFTGKEAIALIDELHRSGGITTIIVEHRLEDVLYRKVDRIVLMEEGQIVSDSRPAELLKSGLLEEYGIREPLYISALKTAGVALDQVQRIEDIDHLEGSDIRGKLMDWQETAENASNSSRTEQLLEVENVQFSYPHSAKQILKGISFTIYRGQMISIAGENGAGKSTIAKLICGFYGADSGTILWKRQNIADLSIKEIADKVGYIMQNPNQMISQTHVLDEVALGLVNRGWNSGDIQDKVAKTLKVCGLYPFRSWPISALSYGQKKRVTIASILVLEPELLILDEPTAGQDFRHYTEMMEFIEMLNQQGKTIIMITHDMHLMLEYSDRSLVILDGEVLLDADPYEVLTNKEIVRLASLKETSLFTLAKKFELPEPIVFTEKFILQDREERKK